MAETVVPVAVGFGYVVWRTGGRAAQSGLFWATVAVVFVPELAAGLASGHLEQTGRRSAGAAVRLLGQLWLVCGVLWLVMRNHPPS